MKVSGTSVILVLLFFTAVAAQPGPKLPLPQYPIPTALMANPIKNKLANAGLEQFQKQPPNVDIKKVNDNVNAVIRNQQDLANFMSEMFEALFTNQEDSHSRGTKPPCWWARVAVGQGKQRKSPLKLWLHQYLKYITKMVEQIPGNKV